LCLKTSCALLLSFYCLCRLNDTYHNQERYFATFNPSRSVAFCNSLICMRQRGSCFANAVGRPRTHAKDNKKENHPVCKTQLVRVGRAQIFSTMAVFYMHSQETQRAHTTQKETAFNSFYGRTIKISAGGQYTHTETDSRTAESDIKFLHRCISYLNRTYIDVCVREIITAEKLFIMA
jgi:hypothetical protein